MTLKKTEDIGEVVDDENVDDELGKVKVVDGEIVAIIAIDVYKGCRNCNAKVTASDANGVIRICENCNTK